MIDLLYKLSDYIKESTETGVGLALKYTDEKYLFFLPGKKYENMKNNIFYAGIGGHLEEGEDFVTCAKREVKEELEADIQLISSEKTWYMHSDGKIENVEMEDNVKPLALYDMIHAEGTPKAGQLYKIIIFNARLSTEPKNLQKYEVGGVIALTREQVVKNVSYKPTLRELVNNGADIVAGCKNLDFDNIYLYPIGTAKALGYILQK